MGVLKTSVAPLGMLLAMRSRHLAVLTYSSVCSARPSGCGLAGRAFLNTLVFFPVRGSVTHILLKRQNMRNIQQPHHGSVEKPALSKIEGSASVGSGTSNMKKVNGNR